MIRHATGFASKTHPAKLLLLWYLFYALIGWLILMLPICQKHPIPLIDSFFMTIATMTTTGLCTLDIGTSFSVVGQTVILLLIQIGGIGYMTFNSFVILSATNRLSKFTKKVTTAEFPLPRDFNIPEFVKHVIIFTLVCETIGAVTLSWIFAKEGVQNPIWSGIFHSISSFCTAGFSTFPDSLIRFKDNIPVNLTVSVLSIIGAIGFITWLNFYKRVVGERKYFSFTAKVILTVTLCIVVFGSFVFFFSEYFLQNEATGNNYLSSFFQVMSASTTAGFHTIDIGTLHYMTIILLFLVMAVGASPSGTGGGLKTTTFVALVGVVKSALKGETCVSFWKREISTKRLQLATATFIYYTFILSIALFFLVGMEDKPFLPVMFEAASALGTIGLSMGITPYLTFGGKLLISLLMLMGKMGILTFGIAITTQHKVKIDYKKDSELVF